MKVAGVTKTRVVRKKLTICVDDMSSLTRDRATQCLCNIAMPKQIGMSPSRHGTDFNASDLATAALPAQRNGTSSGPHVVDDTHRYCNGKSTSIGVNHEERNTTKE
jgi:hypothetical protein